MAIQDIGENAREVLKRRYLVKNERGETVETIEQLFRRVANAVAGAETRFAGGADVGALSERFFEMMTGLKFLPNSPTLMNAGRPLGQLSACFVLPVGDSMEEIFDAVKNAALIHKSGGGTGFSFSRLRPSGATVRSTGGVASGPVSFMRVFNMATEAVKQGGTRRGANMGVLRIDHPDIEDFIHAKSNNLDITNFNISVGLTEAFMQAVEDNRDYDLIDPASGRSVGQKNARRLFELIVDAAWHNGEPGIIFLDRLNKYNATPARGAFEATNPCGEQPLLPYESCNLGSINLTKFLKKELGRWSVDYDALRETVHDAVRFLDDVIEINCYPLAQIDEATRATRKVGLGVMGFADVLLRLQIPYNSEEGVRFAEELMTFIDDEGHAASRALGEVRGAFPAFSESTRKDGPAYRNATVTTIAPTGTISMIGGASSGIEPVFAYCYIRNIMDGTKMLEVNPILTEVLQARGLHDEALMRRIADEGTLSHIAEIPEDIRRVFVCAHDVSPEYHVRMQAAFQRHTDNAVSKTVNFPREATREQVAEVFSLAGKLGLKGVTIYRDGSRDGQVLNIVKAESGQPVEDEGPRVVLPRARPTITQGFTERVKIGCGNLYITVNYDENGICEVFTSTGKAGGCPSQSEATARLCSVALRSGMPVKEIYDQLKGIRCPSTIRQQGMGCTSCPDAIAKVLMKVNNFIQKGTAPTPTPALTPAVGSASAAAGTMNYCPECGAKLINEGGCVVCRSCGYSKCG